MAASSAPPPEVVIPHYRLPDHPLYQVGIFARGVTVYSQQIRALNLAWAMVENKLVSCKKKGAPLSGHTHIGIIGGGFAGLTIAAALIKKGVDAQITIFEHRDTLLPLQQGSDTRWLHPRIYDWPAEESESAVADLPVLNWTAARASDVAAQILMEWKKLAETSQDVPLVYCNAQHLQINQCYGDKKGLIIEWVGESRNVDGSVGERNSVGATKVFDHVILAIGYGLEKDGAVSYWRNDELGQPSLTKPHRTYVVSGQGDGAMIDLLRLRISQYRQDRILDEVIVRLPNLYKAVKTLRQRFPEPKAGMFDAFETLERDEPREFEQARTELTRRLRRDTDVILRLKKRRLAELFDDPERKIAFQNRLLVYLLYKCGGFVPTNAKVDDVVATHSIAKAQLVQRHGTDQEKNLERFLSESLQQEIKKGFPKGTPCEQSEAIQFPGGYFGYPGLEKDSERLEDEIKQEWRKEYLPGATALAALSLCSAIAGLLVKDHKPGIRLRVTLHRSRTVGEDELLQQCCEYVGTSIPDTKLAAARTFPADKATIGLAYTSRGIIRSKKGVSSESLRDAMQSLNLNIGSRDMSAKVGFVMAIPIVQPEVPGDFVGPTPVAAVLYVDSEQPGYFIDDTRLKDVVAILEVFARDAATFGVEEFRRIRNRSVGKRADAIRDKTTCPPEVAEALEIVNAVEPPRAPNEFHLNFDQVDFVPG